MNCFTPFLQYIYENSSPKLPVTSKLTRRNISGIISHTTNEMPILRSSFDDSATVVFLLIMNVKRITANDFFETQDTCFLFIRKNFEKMRLLTYRPTDGNSVDF